jgi:glycosyltransferase involved in cell wall biosynthesis
MAKKIRICFVGNVSRSFVKNDYEILKQYFDVNVIKPPKTKLEWLKYFIILPNKVKQNDLTFSWFAGWHSTFVVFLSRLFRKKSIVVIAGYDVAFAPEINYGAFTNLKEKIAAEYVLKNANLLLPISEFVKTKILEKVKPRQMKLVYLGVDIEKFKPQKEKENMIVTIGRVTEQGIKLKGLETFAKASTYFPDHEFVIIGENEDSAVNKLKKSGQNLIFTKGITHEKVASWLQRAKIYCQLSYIESFGMGVAEAMSCGCIPIVANRGSLPEIVGDTGFCVPYSDEKTTVDMIKKALDSGDALGKKERERIKKLFSYDRRREELKNLILGMK